MWQLHRGLRVSLLLPSTGECVTLCALWALATYSLGLGFFVGDLGGVMNMFCVRLHALCVLATYLLSGFTELRGFCWGLGGGINRFVLEI